MPTIPCPTKIDCQPCNDFPIINVSAETPDVDRFISRFSFLSVPPIRQYPDFDMEPGAAGIFLQVGCMRWCWSTISQADADLCAARQALECALDPLVPGLPPPPSPLVPNRIALYFNQAVTGTYRCPDGNLFSYTLGANQIAALTQGQANAIAFAVAVSRARSRHVCISNLDEPICEGSFYTKQIVASGPNVAVFPATDFWQFIGGTLPPDMTIDSGSSSDGITFSGVATTIGQYNFTIRVTDRLGDFMQKVFTVKVVGINETSPLDKACVNMMYSKQLTAAFSSDHEQELWSVVSGSLPDGLSLSPSGLISGTYTGAPAVGFNFTVQVQFPVGSQTAVCTKNFTIESGTATDLGTVTPDILSATASFFDSGNPQPAGRYRITYETGAMEYANCMPDPCWSVNTVGAGFHYRYFAPGLIDALFPASTNVFDTEAEAWAENDGKFVDFETTAVAAISMYLSDTNYPDNQAGTPNPTFRLFKLC